MSFRGLIVLGAVIFVAGCSLTQPPLVSAAKKQDWAKMNKLIASGKDVNAADSEGKTPLMSVVETGDWTLVNVKDPSSKKEAFGKALELMLDLENQPQYPALSGLLDAGANVNAADKDGKTALMMAAQNGDEYIVLTLLRYKANPYQQDKTGKTALMYATDPNVIHILQKAEDRGRKR